LGSACRHSPNIRLWCLDGPATASWPGEVVDQPKQSTTRVSSQTGETTARVATHARRRPPRPLGRAPYDCAPGTVSLRTPNDRRCSRSLELGCARLGSAPLDALCRAGSPPRRRRPRGTRGWGCSGRGARRMAYWRDRADEAGHSRPRLEARGTADVTSACQRRFTTEETLLRPRPEDDVHADGLPTFYETGVVQLLT